MPLLLCVVKVANIMSKYFSLQKLSKISQAFQIVDNFYPFPLSLANWRGAHQSYNNLNGMLFITLVASMSIACLLHSMTAHKPFLLCISWRSWLILAWNRLFGTNSSIFTFCTNQHLPRSHVNTHSCKEFMIILRHVFIAKGTWGPLQYAIAKTSRKRPSRKKITFWFHVPT